MNAPNKPPRRRAPSTAVARARALPTEDLEEILIELLQEARVFALERYRRSEATRIAARRFDQKLGAD